MSDFKFNGFWFNDYVASLLSNLSLHTAKTRNGWHISEVCPLQILAKFAYLDYLRSLFQNYNGGFAFEEKVEEMYKQEKDYIYFMGDFFKRYISQADKIVDSSSDEESDSDESIVLDFYPSSDDED